MEQNKNHYYDGKFYRNYVDPVLAQFRSIIIRNISKESSVIDLCCGTGDLVFKLAEKCNLVTGVELSIKMIELAEKEKLDKNINNISFVNRDVTSLSDILDDSYDYAVISLALHEMNEKDRIPAMQEAIRISKKVIIADFNTPLPKSIYGYLARIAEFLAGFAHFRGYLSFQQSGGIDELIKSHNLICLNSDHDSKNLFKVSVIQKNY